MSVALVDFWIIHGLIQEGDTWFTEAVKRHSPGDALRAHALSEGAWLSYYRVDLARASSRMGEALEIYRELHDTKGAGEILTRLGQLDVLQGDLVAANAKYDEGLALSGQAGDTRSVQRALRSKGQVAALQGNHAQAQVHFRDAFPLMESLGDQRERMYMLQWWAVTELDGGAFESARARLSESLAIAEALDFPIGLASTIRYFAALAAAQSQPSRALRLAGASETLAEAFDVPPVRSMEPLIQRHLEQSRRDVGAERAAKYRTEGRAMPRDKAIDYALEHNPKGRGRKNQAIGELIRQPSIRRRYSR